MPPRNWHAVVDEFSNVRKLVHLAARRDMFDEERLKTTLLREGRRAYGEELTDLSQRLGCKGRHGQLSNGAYLAELDEIYQVHAKSIINTFNYDLSQQINVVYDQNHRANRHHYVFHLTPWQDMRDDLKAPQITMMTEAVARSLAQQHFYAMNGDPGGVVAVLEPTTAVCPVCQGWIERGEVPISEALNNPPPYHISCPHQWSLRKKDDLSEAECELLWMGD